MPGALPATGALTGRWRTALMALGAILGASWAGSGLAYEMSIDEYRLLPTYCRNQGNVAPRYFKPDGMESWRARLGKDFDHIHHYCWGLVSIARSYRAGLSAGQRQAEMGRAIDDIRFSIERATPDFVLLPEMYTKIGEAFLGIRDDKNAEAAFRKAWEVNPAYWPPYVWWSQRLLKQGKTREALAVAEEGNRNAPGSKALEKLIDDIRAAGKAEKK